MRQDARKTHGISKRAFRLVRISEASLLWRIRDKGFEPKDKLRAWEMMTDVHDLELQGLKAAQERFPIASWAERVISHDQPFDNGVLPIGGAAYGHRWWNECSCSFAKTIQALRKEVMDDATFKAASKRAMWWNEGIKEVEHLTNDELLVVIQQQEEIVNKDKVKWEAYYTHFQQRLIQMAAEEREKYRKLDAEKRAASRGEAKRAAPVKAAGETKAARPAVALTDEEKAARGIGNAIKNMMAATGKSEADVRKILGLSK